MIKFFTASIILLYSLTLFDVNAQRRARPNSVKHNDSEVQHITKKTKVHATHIHDGARFSGPVYMTGGGGAIKVGTSSLSFKAGKYYLKYTAGEFAMREAISEGERLQRGITDYEYEHSWKDEKLGSDFDYSGKYEVVEHYESINLLLYDGSSDNVFAKIPLKSAGDSSFEFAEDDFLFKFSK